MLKNGDIVKVIIPAFVNHCLPFIPVR